MTKDKRYKTVKILIEGGHITEYKEIFDNIPKTTVAEQLGIHFNRFDRIINKVGQMKIDDLFLVASYFEIEAKVLFELINNQYKGSKKAAPKKK